MNIVKRIIRAGKRHLEKGTPGWDYLRKRGVTPEQIEDYDLGFFPEEEWPPYIEEGKSEEGDRYRNWSARGAKLKGQIVFPLRTALGQTMGFILRNPDVDSRGYREFRLQRAKALEVFFGIREAMDHIWSTGEIHLVEGFFDIFPVARVFPTTVCVGTARVDPSQARFLRRVVNKVYFVFDNDQQGRDGYNEFRDKYASDFETVQTIKYRGDDPSEAWQDMGDDRFEDHLKGSLDPLGLGLGDL